MSGESGKMSEIIFVVEGEAVDWEFSEHWAVGWTADREEAEQEIQRLEGVLVDAGFLKLENGSFGFPENLSHKGCSMITAAACAADPGFKIHKSMYYSIREISQIKTNR